MIVDAHTHIGLEIQGFVENKNIYGVKTTSEDQYLKDYKALGVQACFVFASHSFRLNSLCRAENEALAKFNRQYPDQIYAWGTVSPALEEKKLREEIRYAIKDLGRTD